MKLVDVRIVTFLLIHLVIMTAYDILQIPHDSGQAEIKTAYRRLAKLYHPDVNKAPNAPELFAALNQAFEQLKHVKPTPIDTRQEEARAKRAVYGMKLYEFVTPGQKLVEIHCGEHVVPANSCIFLMFMGHEYRVRIESERSVPFLIQVRQPEVLVRVVV